jgi:hypothetical protein
MPWRDPTFAVHPPDAGHGSCDGSLALTDQSDARRRQESPRPAGDWMRWQVCRLLAKVARVDHDHTQYDRLRPVRRG